MTKISFLGAAGEVTGSNYLIDTGSAKYLVDCGLFQGADGAEEANNAPFSYQPKDITAVIVTHAHLDHVGRLPMLVRDGFRGPIYGTTATLELTELVLKDASDLMEERHHRQGQPLLYDQSDFRRTLDCFQEVEYHVPRLLVNGDQATFYDAGHILGSSSVLMSVGGKKILFSGDLGHQPEVFLKSPETPHDADAVVIEATYGARNHPDQPDRETVLKEALDYVVRDNGVLLIPCFAVERAQEILFLLHDLNDKGQLPRIPIFLDSPLAIEVLEVFEKHRELMSGTAKQELDRGEDIFDFRRLVLTSSTEKSRSISDQAPPKVIIAGSGMMEGGRISHHLQNYLSKPSTLLMVIGYQARGTLGQAIVDGTERVTIMNQQVPVKAKVESYQVFSSHADHDELLGWLGQVHLQPQGQVLIVHSDPKDALAFKQAVTVQYPNLSPKIMSLGEIVTV